MLHGRKNIKISLLVLILAGTAAFLTQLMPVIIIIIIVIIIIIIHLHIFEE